MHVKDALQVSLAGMRPSEAEVTRRLLRDLAVVARKSLRDVAVTCRTSDATVVRACRAAGYDGFQDLKYHVLREFTGDTPAVPKEVAKGYEPDIAASLAAAEEALDAAAKILRRAHRVVLAGAGGSQGVALVLKDALFTSRRQALLLEDDQMAAYAFTPPTEGMALIAISHSGETQFPIRMAREAKKAGVGSIALTNEPGSELAKVADVALTTQIVERPAGSFAIAPRVCELAVLDELLTRTGTR